MRHYFDKTPILGAGLASCVMRQLLSQIKSHRGLTSFIEHRGVDGRWLKCHEPYNICITKLFKIIGDEGPLSPCHRKDADPF